MDHDKSAPPLFQAAQYLRMSTENQCYSLSGQAEAIATYARTRGLAVVKTYTDAGKSGLSLKGREGLRQLLADVAAGTQEFSDILVLDVSRWGRFQDPDEAGHYEYLCRVAGYRVHYCAEEFGQEDSIAGSIIKHVKRIMAGEYVRELSARIKFAKRRRARLGHRVGACVGYGLRRQATHQSGAPRAVMEAGERKAITSDHTSVVHGPPDEVATVKRIFDLYVKRRLGIAEIARRLNKQGVPGPGGLRWTRNRIRQVLSYEPYTGTIYYGKTTQFLKADVRPVPRENWIRSQTIEPIITRAIFRRASLILAEVPMNLSEEEIKARLRELLDQKGSLTMRLIGESRRLPSSSTLFKRYGSAEGIYALIGYAPRQRGSVKIRQKKRPDLIQGLRALYDKHGYVTSALIEADPSLPSAHTVAANFGGIGKAYVAAGLPFPSRSVNGRAPGEGPRPKVRPRRKPAITRNANGSPITDEQLISGLKSLLEEHGYLSENLIANAPGLPTPSFYRGRFGSLLETYEAVGYIATRGAILKETFSRDPMYGTWRARAATAALLNAGETAASSPGSNSTP
jgi:DNA invertase Pin-like site-specific DNA recombinase